jgi:hypothetical protein
MDRDTLNVLMFSFVGLIVLAVFIIEPILWVIKLTSSRRNDDGSVREPWKTAQAINDDEWDEEEEL